MILLGCLFDKNEEKTILKNSKIGLPNAINTFQFNLIDGLIQEKQKLKIISVLPVGTFPNNYKQLILKNKEKKYDHCEYKELGCINLPVIKQYQRYKKTLKTLKESKDYEILIYSAYLPYLKAISKLSKKYKITLIVPDLPEFYDLTEGNRLKKIIRKIYNIKINKYINRVDRFVLLTEQMKDYLKIGNKRYVIVEGISSNNKIISSDNDIDKKERIILYTGTLNYKFGILDLLEAFSKIKNHNYKLWICGSGEAEKDIKMYERKDNRIKFFGYLSKDEIFGLQKKSTILINPRKNEGEYTKYSFPSKTIEYMESGKPIIMYKLDGIPNEYDKFLYYIEGNDIESLKEKILEICSKDYVELNDFGKKAQEWVINKKNNVEQAKKIINLINLK